MGKRRDWKQYNKQLVNRGNIHFWIGPDLIKIVLDTTGLKVFGEGEWLAQKYGEKKDGRSSI